MKMRENVYHVKRILNQLFHKKRMSFIYIYINVNAYARPPTCDFDIYYQVR